MLSAVIPARRSYPAVHQAAQLDHQGSVQPNPLVLKLTPLKFATPTTGRDRPGSRRSEPSSRTTLIGEQPNPWDRLQPQDVMGRHRGAKPRRRYGRSGAISLLSPGYLLSVERRTLPGFDMSRIFLKEKSAFGNVNTGGAWLLSARAVRGWVKSRNERNPYH